MLKSIDGQIVCPDCDQSFSDRLHLKAGQQCPTVSCPSNASTLVGRYQRFVSELQLHPQSNIAVNGALAKLLPVRADPAATKDAELLHNLRTLYLAVDTALSKLEA